MIMRQNLQLVFQNSKELKEVRRFVKSLHYIYDCISKRDKKVYMYVTKSYISLTTDFTQTKSTEIYPAICTLRKSHIVKSNGIKNLFEGKSNDEGFLYLIEAESIIKFLNSHVEPDIIHMNMILPIPLAQNQMAEMTLTYETVDGIEVDFTIFTNIENCENWPYPEGRISSQSELFKKSPSFKFMSFPPKFSQKIDYLKKYSDFWLSLTPGGVNLQRPDKGRIVSDQCIKVQNSLQYNHFELEQYLQGSNYLCIKTGPFFHHLELSNKDGKKCTTRIQTLQSYLNNNIQKCYLIMQTVTDKRQIFQAFEIYPTRSMTVMEQTNKTTKMVPKMINQQAKKEEDQEGNEMIILNKYYGIQYEEEMNELLTVKQGFISTSNNQKAKDMPMVKRKIEID